MKDKIHTVNIELKNMLSVCYFFERLLIIVLIMTDVVPVDSQTQAKEASISSSSPSPHPHSDNYSRDAECPL